MTPVEAELLRRLREVVTACQQFIDALDKRKREYEPTEATWTEKPSVPK